MKPNLAAERTEFCLDTLAAYTAELLGDDWSAGQEDGYAVVRLGGYTVALQPLPSGSDDYQVLSDFAYGADGVGEFDPLMLGVGRDLILLAGFGGNEDDDFQSGTVAAQQADTLHQVATAVAREAELLHAEYRTAR